MGTNRDGRTFSRVLAPVINCRVVQAAASDEKAVMMRFLTPLLLLLAFAAARPAAAQTHFPSDSAIRATVQRVIGPPLIGQHLLDPRYPLSMSGLKRAFSALAVTLGLLLVVGVFVAWRRTGATTRRAGWATLWMAIGVLVWMSVTHILAALGLIRFDTRPPTMAIVFVALLVLAFGVGVSRVGGRLATGLPLAVLVGVHAFRLPLELMLHRAYSYGLMPVQMSYSGLNFDIVTGTLAIVVAILVATGRAGLRTVRMWNLLGALLLVNVVVIAWLSTPTPLRVFKNSPANVWIARPPYIWLPTVMVAFAILGHIVLFRRLRLEDERRSSID